MGRTDPTPLDRQSEDCSTTDSFSDHGIVDGATLVSRTHRRLAADGGVRFKPTDEFFDRLEEAFVWAYLGSVTERGVPKHVEAAIDDAKLATAQEFADRPDADLRTEVITTFYQYVAGFHCAYRERTPEGPGGSPQE